MENFLKLAKFGPDECCLRGHSMLMTSLATVRKGEKLWPSSLAIGSWVVVILVCSFRAK